MEFILTDDPKPQDIEELFDRLKQFNLSQIELKEAKPIAVFANDETATRIGGITGETHGNWLEIEYLFVDKDHRAKNIGSQLLKKVEEEAIKRGCKYAFVNTFGFQAKEFYVKLGYQEVFALKNYPLTGTRHYFTKQLV